MKVVQCKKSWSSNTAVSYCKALIAFAVLAATSSLSGAINSPNYSTVHQKNEHFFNIIVIPALSSSFSSSSICSKCFFAIFEIKILSPIQTKTNLFQTVASISVHRPLKRCWSVFQPEGHCSYLSVRFELQMLSYRRLFHPSHFGSALNQHLRSRTALHFQADQYSYPYEKLGSYHVL